MLTKYVVDDTERNRFLKRQTTSTEQISSDLSVCVKVDAFTQTERFTYKRNFHDGSDFSEKLESAKESAKKKREEKYKKAMSVLENRSKIVGSQTAIASSLSQCKIAK